MSEHIAKYWVTWACGLLAAALVFCRKRAIEICKERKKRREAAEYAYRYMLFLKLKEIYKESEARGYITVDDLADAEATYKHYHNIGGNGKATIMMQVMREMEVRSEA